VLADTEPVHFECWREVLREFEIELNWPYYTRECIGVDVRVMIERMGAARTPAVPLDVLWPAYSRKKDLFRERIGAVSPFETETCDLLHAMHGGYKMAVVSSRQRTEIEPPLERAGIRPLFQAIVGGADVPNLKPAPDPYLRAAELLGARKPLVIEDSDAGVASGRAAGFDVLRINSARNLAQELREYLGLR